MLQVVSEEYLQNRDDALVDQLSGICLKNKTIEVEHAKLARCGDSPYRSVCPVCKEGILLVRRNDTTMRLMRNDNCIMCGQSIRYVGKLGFSEAECPKDDDEDETCADPNP